MLEENDTLAAEATSEKDDDGAGGERLSGFCWADCFAGLE